MKSSEETDPFYQALSTCLANSLSGPTWHIARTTEPPPGMLLVTGTQDLAGFVVGDRGAPRKTYEDTYESFMGLYRNHVREWDPLSLAFVFCPIALAEEDEEFWISVEGDTRFCRKFVIQAELDPQRLQRSLLRLPFVPFDRADTVSLGRPVAAQDLLRASGVSAELADRLLSTRSSEDAIADSCLSRDAVTVQTAEAVALRRSEWPSSASSGKRIISLDVSEFRAYRGSHSFDLSADLTVLYGPNGLGKTSLFDAIDFACTGRLGRFASRAGRGPTPLKLVRHLDAQGETQVRMTVGECLGKSAAVIRRGDRWDRATVDQAPTDRKGLLQWLGCGEGSETVDRVENLERLFRSCHLFGQDYQALLAQFRDSSQLETDIVARMLALEDYVRGSRKACQVADVVARRGGELRTKRDEAAQKLRTMEEMRSEIRAGLQDAGSPEAIGRAAAAVAKGLSVVLGVTVCAPDGFTADHVREWRTEAVGASSRLRTLVAEVGQIESRLPETLAAKQKMPRVQARLAESRAGVTALSRDRAALLKAAGDLRQHYDATLDAIERTRKEQEGLTWLAKAGERLTALDGSTQQFTSVLAVERAKMDEARRNLAESGRNRREIEEATAAHVALLNQARTRLATLRVVAENAVLWNDWRTALARNDAMLRELSHCRDENSRQRQLTSEQLEGAQELSRKADEHLRTVASAQARLAAILGQVAEFVRDATCPTCGSDLGTRERLLAAIAARTGGVPDEQMSAAANSERLRQDVATSAERAQSLAREEERLGAEIRVAQEQRDKLSALSADFEARLRAAELPTSFDQLGEVVKRRVIAEEEQTRSLEERVTALQAQRDGVMQAGAALERAVAALNVSISSAQNGLGQVQRETEGLRNEAQRRGILLQPDNLDLPGGIAALGKTLDDATRGAEGTQAKLKEQERLVVEMSESLAKSASALQDLERDETDIRERVSRHEEALARNGLPMDSTPEQLREARAQAAARLATCDATTAEINAIEQMLMASARTAELVAIEAELSKRTDEIRALDQEISRCGRWRECFVSIGGVLDRTRSAAVDGYTTGLGPTVSVLQQRLRPVFGFGELHIQSSEGNLRAVVDRAGKELVPTDFFSESQKQVLMLSLFLAIASTQTWSSFAPVLLDDPVTHFDDLNAYAFVELIRGLLTGHSGVPRQFVISTCDERLYQMIRQQFAPLKSRVNYYEFRSIGSGGPVYDFLAGT